MFRRSARMGVGYLAIGVVLGVGFTTVLDVAMRYAQVPAGAAGSEDIAAAAALIVIPLTAMAGLMASTPVYLLFVNDKNEGVLEYLLAVGMGQRDVFKGYLKAAVMVSLVAMMPAAVLNLALSPSGVPTASAMAALSLATGVADVALVTVLMTSFSSMQSRPTGMNSPLGIGVGVFILLPEMMLFSVFGTAIVWLDFGVAVTVLAVAAVLLVLIDRFIRREKLLP